MKSLHIRILASAMVMAIATVAAFAQGLNLVTVDELGNGNWNGQPLPSFISPDPFAGIATLTYRLPWPGVPGDVYLFEPNTPVPGPPSDIIRFDGQSNMYFYSERETTDQPPFDPADVFQFPPPIAALQVINLMESGPEGNNGAFYTPPPGGPGANSVGASYHFVSDVPEPATLALLGIASGLLIPRRRRLPA